MLDKLCSLFSLEKVKVQPFDEDKHCCQIINLVRMMHVEFAGLIQTQAANTPRSAGGIGFPVPKTNFLDGLEPCPLPAEPIPPCTT